MFNSLVNSVFINGSDTDYLLFKIAIHYAEEGSNVWLISCKPIQRFPDNFSVPNKDVLKTITFLYLSTIEDLVKKLNSIHVWKTTPQVIIILDYERYIINSDDSIKSSTVCAYVTASVNDAALACARKLATINKQKKRSAFVFVSCNYGNQHTKHKHLIQCLINLFFTTVLNTHNKSNDDSFNELIALLK